MNRLPRAFFERDVVVAARELVGCELFWGECRGVIVETEAYSAVGDEASHVFFRPGARRFIEAHPPGTAYVYLNYGVHWMLNVLVHGDPHRAVAPANGMILIRAVEPTLGLALMHERRGVPPLKGGCNGPGKLTRAFGITGEHHGINLCGAGAGEGSGGPGFGPRPAGLEGCRVESDRRVGITRSVELPWRFLLEGSPYVSIRPGRVRVPVRRARRRKPESSVPSVPRPGEKPKKGQTGTG